MNKITREELKAFAVAAIGAGFFISGYPNAGNVIFAFGMGWFWGVLGFDDPREVK